MTRPRTISIDELSAIAATQMSPRLSPPRHTASERAARGTTVPPRRRKPRGITDGVFPDTTPARSVANDLADDLGVCQHGESPGDCDVCSMGAAIDAYDAGLLDD